MANIELRDMRCFVLDEVARVIVEIALIRPPSLSSNARIPPLGVLHGTKHPKLAMFCDAATAHNTGNVIRVAHRRRSAPAWPQSFSN